MKQLLNSSKLFIAIVLFSLIAGLNSNLSAQGLTSAGINGLVTDKNGSPLIGANVVAIHVPSGTVFGSATREDGRYNIVNAKAGGPYTIRVSYIGFKQETVNNVKLELSQNLKLDFKLSEESIQGDEIVVTADRNSLISSSRTGAGTNVSVKQLETLPTINRSIQDFTRLTPQIVGGNAASRNSKYNSIQVDGAVLNDVFGLPSNGTPGGQAGTEPISLDAIEQFKVSVSPFDIRQGGFTGASINAITRSGTNNFAGSAYYYGRNQSFVGKGPDNKAFADFSQNTYGFRFGGPILQDQLFFFINGELGRKKQPDVTAVNTAYADSLNQAIQFLKTKGYDPGTGSNSTIQTNNNKLFLRLDYNINQDHRLTLRHNFVSAENDNLSRSTSSFYLSNSGYKFQDNQNSTVLQLNSTFSNSMSNELRFAYTRVRDKRDPYGAAFPQLKITKTSQNFFFGTEQFSIANKLDQDYVEFTDDFSYYMGDHVITVGTHNEFLSFDNLFMRNLYGYYEFPYFKNLLAEKASNTQFSYSTIAGNSRPSAKFGAKQLGFYAQDEWTVMPNLKLTIGLRIDIPSLNDKPLFNQKFSDIYGGMGYSTDKVPGAKILWSPRIGFNYDVFNDKQTQVRGGTGIFTGRVPFVWVSNAFGNTGVDIIRASKSDASSAPTPTIPFISDPNGQPIPPVVAATEIDILDKDFKFPQLFRTNIAVDQQLPFGLIGTLEYVYSKSLNDVWFVDINRTKSGTLIDGRPIYGTKINSANFTNVILMKNTSDGYQSNFTAQLQKPFGEGDELLTPLEFGLSYTYSKAEDVNSATSSQAYSQVRFTPVYDAQKQTLSTSDFSFPHRILATASYRLEYFEDYTTDFSFIYEGRSGSPYSYIFNGDANGDGSSDNDLAYVPLESNDPNVIFNTPAEMDNLNAFINKNDYLKDNRGKTLKRNGGRFPWINQFDLKIVQRIAVPSLDGHNVEISLDILNVLNLLNKTWGVQKSLTTNKVIKYNGVDAQTGKMKLGFDPTIKDQYTTNLDNSRWYMQFGIRYTF